MDPLRYSVLVQYGGIWPYALRNREALRYARNRTVARCRSILFSSPARLVSLSRVKDVGKVRHDEAVIKGPVQEARLFEHLATKMHVMDLHG
ncbi:MAG: hypothetical protein M1823_002374 [Watsoniomyces obsoletus]|nr:MAG: hypothetical protein M1823_002374 [Watsoniomyces obsoletus]